MAQPLLATDRIVFNYQVASLVHRLVTYAKAGSVIAGVNQVVQRDGITQESWIVAAQFLWDGIRAILDTTVTPANISLESRTGIVWVPVTTSTLTGNGTAGAIFEAAQLTIKLNDTGFKKINFLIMEHSAGLAGHSNNGLGLSMGITNLVTGLTTDAAPAAPYQWLKSRGDRYIAASGACRGGTLSSNDKLRRARGLV